MAVYRSFKCCNCNAMLRIDGDRRYVFCEYCGTQNILDGAENMGGKHDYDNEDEFDYRGPYDKELEMERMRMKERENERDYRMIIGIFVFVGLMLLIGSIFK